jgi:hypothetical protein
LANEQALVIFSTQFKANEAAIEPNAAHKNQSEGSLPFAVLYSAPLLLRDVPPLGHVPAASLVNPGTPFTASLVVFTEVEIASNSRIVFDALCVFEPCCEYYEPHRTRLAASTKLELRIKRVG